MKLKADWLLVEFKATLDSVFSSIFTASHVDEPFLEPADLTDESWKENPVYSSPIVIIPGKQTMKSCPLNTSPLTAKFC